MIVKGSPRKDGHALAVYFINSEDGARRIFGTDPMADTIMAMTEWDELGSRGEFVVISHLFLKLQWPSRI